LPESQLANDDLLFKKIVPALLNVSNISLYALIRFIRIRAVHSLNIFASNFLPSQSKGRAYLIDRQTNQIGRDQIEGH
jgi:hypothetical protein